MDIGGGLALNAKDVTIKAGTEETISTNGGASANASPLIEAIARQKY
jgi:hypothetical protein